MGRFRPAGEVLFCFGTVVLLLLFGKMVYLPQCGRVAALTAQARALRAKAERTEAFFGRHPDLAADEQALQARLAALSRRFPEQPDGAALAARLEEAAAASGARLCAVNQGAEAAAENWTRLPVEAEFRGDYAAILDLTRRIERFEPFCRVRLICLNAAEHTLSCRVRMELYAYPRLKTTKKQENERDTSNSTED